MQNKKTIYLHIGSNNTSTEHIQKFLYNNSELLYKNDYFYPEIKDGFDIKGYSNLEILFRKITMTLKNKKVSSFEEIKRRWKKYYEPIINGSVAQNIILSSNESEKFFVDLYEFLTKEGFEVKVIIYIKKPAEYAIDLWCNEITENKNSKIFMHPVTYFTKERNNIYDNIIKILSNIHSNNVIVRPYEIPQMKNNSLLEDFLTSIGIEATEQFNYIKNDKFDYNVNEMALLNIANLLEFEAKYINVIKDFVSKTHENSESLKSINILSDKKIEKITNFYLPKIEQIQKLSYLNQLFLNVYPNSYQKLKEGENKIHFNEASFDLLFSLMTKKHIEQNNKKKFLYIKGNSYIIVKLFKYYFKFDVKK